MTPLSQRVPFQCQLDRHEARPTVSGKLPEWLTGRLVRTAPAIFEQGRWAAAHWFDGLGMLYAFTFEGGQSVRFTQRQLDSDYAKNPSENASFGTRLDRGFFKRLITPIPRSPDNTNVNVLPFGDDLVALTETERQWVIDPETLAARHHLEWQDDAHYSLLAHPQFDFEKQVVVNVGTVFGRTPALAVVEHAPNGRVRREIGRWERARVPYAHSFGLTTKRVVLVGHPFDVAPLGMLWSNRGYISHFRWRPEQGTRYALMNRATGEVTEFEGAPLFVFHTVNAFEEGDATVLDVIAYDDASIINRLEVASVLKAFPEVRSKLVRIRFRHGAREATVERLTDASFEFPVVSYRRHSGQAYSQVWGAALWREHEALHSHVLRVDVRSGERAVFDDPEYVFGEPLFVARPGGIGEADGVLLTVGSHRTAPQACAQLLDAQSLLPVARVTIDVPLPLGFHGSFISRS